MLLGVTKWSPISGNDFFLGGGGGMVGLAINLIEMNHKISVYYVKWGVVIHLVLALIVQLRYVFFAPKFCTDTILHFWVTTCQGIVQYAYRYTKASEGVPGDSGRWFLAKP